MRFESLSSLSLITGALVVAPFIGCGGDGNENAGGAGGSGASTSSSGGSGGSAGTGGSGGSAGSASGGGGSGGAPGPKCTATMAYVVEANNIQDVVVDADSAFYIQNNGDDSDPGGVFRVALGRDGAKPTKLADSNQPIGLALANGTVVFGDSDGGIFTVPAAGGSKKKIAPTANAPSHLIATKDTVYFSDDDGTKSVPVAGGEVKTLTDQVAFSLAVWDQSLVLADYFGGQVFTVPVGGGTPTLIGDMQQPLYPVVVDSSVVWANAGQFQNPAGANLTAFTPGGSPMAISTGADLFHPQGMVFDGTNFYLSCDMPPRLVKVPKEGGTPALVTTLASDSGLAVDDTCVYTAQPSKGLGAIAK